MKVEIELEYIERLKREISQLVKEKDELSDKLKSLDERKLKDDAINLAAHIFSESLTRVFKEIGFADSVLYAPHNFMEFERILGVNWYSSERLQVQLGAEITNEMRRAFLRMGIESECSAI